MPNLEVKPASVDGTVRGTHGRADHCQFRFKRGSPYRGTSFFIATFYLQQSYTNAGGMLNATNRVFMCENFFFKTCFMIEEY